MDWIKEILTNEDDAISALYRQYRSEALSWLRKHYQLDEVQSLDIFQESIVQLYHNIISNKLTSLNSSIKSYLFGICKNKIKEYRRQYPKLDDLSYISNAKLFSDDQIIKHKLEEKETLEAQVELVKKYMDELGDPCKKILELFYFRGKNMSEITEILSYNNSNTTKNQKYKCIKRLQLLINLHKE